MRATPCHATNRGTSRSYEGLGGRPRTRCDGRIIPIFGMEKKIRLVGTTKQKVGDIMIPGYPLFSTIFEVASAIPMRKLHHAVLLRPCGWISDSHRSCSNTPIGVIMHSWQRTWHMQRHKDRGCDSPTANIGICIRKNAGRFGPLSAYNQIYICLWLFMNHTLTHDFFMLLFNYVFICLSMYLPIYSFIYSFMYSFMDTSTDLSIYLSIYLYCFLSIFLSFYISIFLSIFLSIYPSIYLLYQ